MEKFYAGVTLPPVDIDRLMGSMKPLEGFEVTTKGGVKGLIRGVTAAGGVILLTQEGLKTVGAEEVSGAELTPTEDAKNLAGEQKHAEAKKQKIIVEICAGCGKAYVKVVSE